MSRTRLWRGNGQPELPEVGSRSTTRASVIVDHLQVRIPLAGTLPAQKPGGYISAPPSPFATRQAHDGTSNTFLRDEQESHPSPAGSETGCIVDSRCRG